MKNNRPIQYERWPFPNNYFISREGLLFIRHLDRYINDSGKPNIKVIDVGCGTGNTLIPLAQRYSQARFIGVDLSESSLEIAIGNAAEKGLANVEFRKADVLNLPLSRMGKFDIILCLGVLHHVRNMQAAFQNLVALLRKDGRIILWFYGRHGRYKHRLNQKFIEMLSKKSSSEEKYSIARTLIREDGGKFVLNTGFFTPKGTAEDSIDWLIDNPQWLVDQFIPAVEKAVTMKELYNLFEKNNLRIINWLGVRTEIKDYFPSGILKGRWGKLSRRERFIALDYLLKPEYYFLVVEKDKSGGGER